MKTTNALKTALAGMAAVALLGAGIPGAAHADMNGVIVGPRTPAPTRAPGCTPSAPFESLRAQAGTHVVGTAVDCARYTAAGDQVQPTTTGQFLWRKADNWSGFTNGSRTWILVPTGVASRPNDQRFEWEPDFGAPGTLPYAPPAPPPVPAEPEPLVPGTQLGLPVTGPVMTMTPLAFEQAGVGLSGSRLVKVTVKVERGVGRVGAYDAWDFRLRSPEGVEYRPSVLEQGRPGSLGSGQLSADLWVVGDLWFEVPAGAGGFGLHYYPSGISAPTVAISRWLGGAA